MAFLAVKDSLYGASCRPILKWAGGKTQLLSEICLKAPAKYGSYIEPFLGGGAVFFALCPKNAVIADSNPELINVYKAVAENVDDVISCLYAYRNTEEDFYAVRALDWHTLSCVEAAARTIYLNKTCFNGLYRVNKAGQFNVPFGRYKNPKIVDVEGLQTASLRLRDVEIACADYKETLLRHARAGDFVFLDPPYLPISQYSDFKRYTKEQFYEEDHVGLAVEIKRLHELGCHVVLTNSNHPLVHDLYQKFTINIVQTKRYISCNGARRTGEDVIVSIPPQTRFNLTLMPAPLPPQVDKYPPTRFMGSKNKLLRELWAVASQFKFDTVVDLFSGSGIVSYMLKAYGKTVISNDHMAMAATFSKAMVENAQTILPEEEMLALFEPQGEVDNFVTTTFHKLYFSDSDNQIIDIVRSNIKLINNPYKKAIAMSALVRACLKKRPRGIFTYIGQRYNDGRKDLQMGFREQLIEATLRINEAIFDNGKLNRSVNSDAMEFKSQEADLVYIDPPYYSPLSDNEYVRRYHFVEGLARDWQGVEIQEHTITKKFKSYPTPFSSRKGAAAAFDVLFKKFRNSILIVSYSSNSLPTLDEMLSIMAKYKKHVDVVPVDYKYSFGSHSHTVGKNNNSVQEFIFVGY